MKYEKFKIYMDFIINLGPWDMEIAFAFHKQRD